MTGWQAAEPADKMWTRTCLSDRVNIIVCSRLRIALYPFDRYVSPSPCGEGKIFHCAVRIEAIGKVLVEVPANKAAEAYSPPSGPPLPPTWSKSAVTFEFSDEAFKCWSSGKSVSGCLSFNKARRKKVLGSESDISAKTLLPCCNRISERIWLRRVWRGLAPWKRFLPHGRSPFVLRASICRPPRGASCIL